VRDEGNDLWARLGVAPGRLAAVSVIGGLVITLGDHLFHVRTEVVEHHWHPQVGGQSVWVVPQFVVGAAAMILVAQLAVRRLPPPTIQHVAASVALFYAAYWLTGAIGVDHPWITLELLLVTYVVRMLATKREARWPLLALGIAIGAGGCVAEALSSRAGSFDYAYEDLVVPLWLFPLYLHGAAAVAALAWFARPDRGPSAVDGGTTSAR
jgi:hypothetical protein